MPIIFAGGVYVGKNSAHGAERGICAPRAQIMRAAQCKPFQTETQRSGCRLRYFQKPVFENISLALADAVFAVREDQIVHVAAVHTRAVAGIRHIGAPFKT